MKILHVVPHAHPSTIARELSMLLAESCSDEDTIHVVCLGEDGIASQPWRTAGAEVEALHWRRWLDLRPLWTLARRIREWQPTIIVAWSLPALRAVRLTAPAKTAVVVRQPCAGECPDLSVLDRWSLRSVDLVLASGAAEAQRCAAAGLPEGNVVIVPPGVQLSPPSPLPTKRRIICAGALLPQSGFHDAIWALDIVRHGDDEVELTIAGEGPERRRLEEFVARTGLQRRIHLLGETSDIGHLLAQASLIWVPSLTDSGSSVVLQAMAAGRPLIASHWPGLAEIIADGETGILVKPGDKMDLARRTRHLLQDATLCRKLGEAGRRRVEQEFSASSFVDEFQRACAGLAATRSGAGERTETRQSILIQS